MIKADSATQPAIPAAPPATPPTITVVGKRPDQGGMTFRQVLSDLNPLQYLPGVGTIYRAVTGDTIPDALQSFGSLLFSGLTGGPVGLAASVAEMVLEKATGIDPDAIGQEILADVGIGIKKPPAAKPVETAKATAPTTAATAAASTPIAASTPSLPAAGWTTAQLLAQGVSTGADGTLSRGELQGADVLNAMELTRLGRAVAAYNDAGDAGQSNMQAVA